jgi:hypothetical protein
MTALQIARLDACAADYNKLVSDVKRYVAEGEKAISAQMERQEPQSSEDNYWTSVTVENRAALSKLEGNDESLILDWYTKGITVNGDFRFGSCTVEMFGGTNSPSFGFENGKLTSIHFKMGTFNNDKYQALHKALSEKYDSVTVPTSEQIGLFNNKELSVVSATYAANQVQLSIAHTSFGKLVNLYYFTPDKAAEVVKESAVGQVKSGDL